MPNLNKTKIKTAMIDTKIHGYLDYMMGALLLLLPLLFDLPDGAATTIPVVLGAGAILYSLITDYELGILKILSMKVHLGLDLMSGLLLAASPWLFDFADDVYLPFVILGIIEIGAALMTKKHPEVSEAPK